MKGYVHSLTRESDPKGIGAPLLHVDFTFKKEHAYCWSIKQDAESLAGTLEHHDITIKTAEEQRYVCRGYEVEEREPGKFIVWVEAPFNPPTETDKTAPAA